MGRQAEQAVMQLVAIVREVQLLRCGRSEDRYAILGPHCSGQIVPGGVACSRYVLNRHVEIVEKQSDESLRRGLSNRRLRGARRSGVSFRSRGLWIRYLDSESGNFLRLTAIKKSKILLFQVPNGPAISIADHHRYRHQAGLDANAKRGSSFMRADLRLLGALCHCSRASRKHPNPRGDKTRDPCNESERAESGANLIHGSLSLDDQDRKSTRLN